MRFVNQLYYLPSACNVIEKRIRVEEYKAVEVVRKFIDRMLGV